MSTLPAVRRWHAVLDEGQGGTCERLPCCEAGPAEPHPQDGATLLEVLSWAARCLSAPILTGTGWGQKPSHCAMTCEKE